MKEIDNMLETWIYNSIIREELRKLIVKHVHYSKYGYNVKENKDEKV